MYNLIFVFDAYCCCFLYHGSVKLLRYFFLFGAIQQIGWNFIVISFALFGIIHFPQIPEQVLVVLVNCPCHTQSSYLYLILQSLKAIIEMDFGLLSLLVFTLCFSFYDL